MSVNRTLVSWGELLWDEFPSGACLGGAPANVAFHMHHCGAPTTLITRLGRDDLGARAEDELRRLGLDLGGLQFDEKLPTGRVGIELREGEAHYTLHPGAWQAITCDSPAQERLATSRAFCYGTLSQESAQGLRSWREALQFLPVDTLRVCDPNLRGSRIDPDLVHEHVRAANILKINDDEAAIMAKTYDQHDLIAWLLDEMQVSLVALTHGSKGATLYTRSECVHHAGFAAESQAAERDNVGAGDSFVAVLVCARVFGASLEDTLKAANRYASFVASRRGATPQAPAELLTELKSLISER